MENINTAISENLKRLREQKKLSLDTVAKLSGVSKSMLGQIERGEANPTISTVWKIANGLRVSFSELLSQPAEEHAVVDIDTLQPLLEDGGHYRNYVLFPFDSGRRFEMVYIELDPGSHLEAEAHPEGTQEFLTVFSGELLVQVDGRALCAKARGAVRFRADRPHQYRNIGSEVCAASMVIFYPA